MAQQSYMSKIDFITKNWKNVWIIPQVVVNESIDNIEFSGYDIESISRELVPENLKEKFEAFGWSVQEIDGHDIHFKEWMATDDCIYYLPLATLVDNGCATFYKHECIVPYENVYMIDDEDKSLLGIPESYNKAIRLRSESMLNNLKVF